MTKKKTAAATPPRRRGRPNGSKTQALPSVDFIPPACPACDNQARTVLAKLPDTSAPGAGVRVVRRRVQCNRCAQVYFEREHHRTPT